MVRQEAGLALTTSTVLSPRLPALYPAAFSLVRAAEGVLVMQQSCEPPFSSQADVWKIQSRQCTAESLGQCTLNSLKETYYSHFQVHHFILGYY